MDTIIPASETLVPGDFVNIYNNGGIANVRRANASTAGASRVAHGFVKVATAEGSNATVYLGGSNDHLTGLTPGVTYALSPITPGATIELEAATIAAGGSLQVLGLALSTTTLNVNIAQPIIRG